MRPTLIGAIYRIDGYLSGCAVREVRFRHQACGTVDGQVEPDGMVAELQLKAISSRVDHQKSYLRRLHRRGDIAATMMGFDTIIGLASLAIAIPGLVQTFVHAGRWLSERLQEANGTTKVSQIQDFMLYLDRGIMRTTLEAVEDVYVDTSDPAVKVSLDNRAKRMWAYMIQLEQHIRKVNSPLNSQRQTDKAVEAALASIDAMRGLELQLRTYIQSQVAAKAMRSRFDLRTNQFCVVGVPKTIEHSVLKVALGDFSTNARRGSESCVIEEKRYPGSTSRHAYESAVALARTLQFFNASNGLLELIGFQVLSPSPLTDSVFRYIFAFPDKFLNPRSLRDVLLDPVNRPTPPIPRNFRFVLPRKLAESLYQVHRQNLVHKCIRPESILLFEPAPGDSRETKYPKVIGKPFLVDWKHVRKTVEVSMRQGYDDWTMMMYQHPSRQALPGSLAESKYNIGHDIYSLGICLLEIGLWESLIVYDGDSPRLSTRLANAKARWKIDNTIACQRMTDSEIEQIVFIELAGTQLAYEMGEAYSKLVIKCLTCIEKGFGNVLKFVDSSSREWDEQGDLFIQEIRRSLNDASTMGTGIYNRIS